MMKIKQLTILGCALWLTGCISNETRPTLNKGETVANTEESMPPATSGAGLTSDMVYETLASEIAVQRRDYPSAVKHALNAARETHNPDAAERAAHIAVQANLNPQAQQAVELWIQLEPQSLKAHQLAALLHLRDNQPTQASRYLRRVITIANENGQNGYLQAAAIAEKASTPEQSLALIQQLIPLESTDPEALYALALTANRAQQYALAEQAIRNGLEQQPDWTKGLLLLSRTLIQQGKKDAGLNILGQAVEKSPDNGELRLTYARMLIESQQYIAAVEQFETLDKLSPDNPDTLYALGVLHSELGHHRKAESFFKRLITMGEKTDEAQYHLGLIAEKEDKLDAALDRYERVGGDNQIDARIRMARILAKRDSVEKGRELLQQLRINSPQHTLKLYLVEADLLRNARKYHDAHEIYTHTLELDADNLELYYARGLNAVDMGRLDILEQDMGYILAQQPDHADAHNALGYTLADRTDRLDEARRHIEKAMALKPGNPAILDSMGWLEYRQGNLQQALSHLQQAADIHPDAEIASHLGEVLWQLNRKQEAIEVWKTANEKDPDNPFIAPVMQRFGITP
jgi:tetratricopeptide (TPR) repeat protein